MTMTEKLDILMSERGINKSQLSRLSGIPYMTIVNFYEKGTENIKRSTLVKLSRFFSVTVDYLIIDEETRRAYPSIAAQIRSNHRAANLCRQAAHLQSPKGSSFIGQQISPAMMRFRRAYVATLRCGSTETA
jgi:transcriptional regulator with XRE-family HTH domain